MSTILLGFSMAVIAEIMSISSLSSTRLERQFDTQMASRAMLDRIKKDVRMASVVCPGNLPGSTNHRCSLWDESDHGTTELILGPQTLILHLPVLYLDKTNDPADPNYSPTAPLSSRTGVRMRGYDTVIYRVVADNDPGKYKLVLTVIPSPIATTGARRSAISDSGVATGIVGPISTSAGSGPPEIFKYVSKNPVASVGKPGRLDTISKTALSVLASNPASKELSKSINEGISGVTIDCEFLRGNQVTDSNSRTSAVHTEAYLRLPLQAFGPTSGDFYE